MIIVESLLRMTELWKGAVVTTFLLIGVIVNLKVLYAVYKLPKRKQRRPGSILVVHLSSVAIFFAGLNVLLVVDDANLIDLNKPGLCEMISFLKRAVVGIFALNVFALLFERFHTFNCFNGGKLRLRKLILLIWIVSIVISIPTIFMRTYTKQDFSETHSNLTGRGKCQGIPLFGSIEATAFYEIVRFFVFHAFVVGYMIYAMYKIRASVSQLYLLKPIPDNKTQRKVKTIRFFYLHLISFIATWIPYGVLTLAERVISRTLVVQTLNTNSSLRSVLGLLLYIYVVLNPLIYLWLMPDQRRISKIKAGMKLHQTKYPTKPGLQERVQRNSKKASEDFGELTDARDDTLRCQTDQITSVEISRVSTFMPTSTATVAKSNYALLTRTTCV